MQHVNFTIRKLIKFIKSYDFVQKADYAGWRMHTPQYFQTH